MKKRKAEGEGLNMALLKNDASSWTANRLLVSEMHLSV
jgi:hypothetical protein